MLQNIGERIRTLRIQKGIGLNAFAEIIGVSPGYLSNLETGKTDTLQISVLQKIQNELNLLPLDLETSEEIEQTMKRLLQRIDKLKSVDPEGADYLITTFENGIELLLKKNRTIL